MRASAIVLSGGSSRRLGRDKTVELVGGRSLLQRVVDALTGVERVIVVGSSGTVPALPTIREDPPGGGPVAALSAGVREVATDDVFVLAGDLPFLTPAALSQLSDARAADRVDVALAVDSDGRDQYLLALWSAGALRRALAGVADPVGARLGTVYREATTARVHLAGDPPPWFDCDTADDLARARMLADR